MEQRIPYRAVSLEKVGINKSEVGCLNLNYVLLSILLFRNEVPLFK